ncbi:MAG: SGNH/GDSL hydrolase family protein [Planctomycetota bacterium]|jgi:acyl-CoA thioesterase-1
MKRQATESELRDEKVPEGIEALDPSLPNVFIIGDSISLGYTPYVKELLAGRANVRRPACNCQHTAFGLEHIRGWLGETCWDVIHFNWGIWDTHYICDGPNDFHLGIVPSEQEDIPNKHIRHDLGRYTDHLRKLVGILQEAGETLIWAHSTPIMRRQSERFEHIRQYNEAAADVMAASGVTVNDLYGYIFPDVASWQSEDKVHFTEEGSQHLAARVVERIGEKLSPLS